MLEYWKNLAINPGEYFKDPINLRNIIIIYYITVLLAIGGLAFFVPEFSLMLLAPLSGSGSLKGFGGLVAMFLVPIVTFIHLNLLLSPLIISGIVKYLLGTEYSKTAQPVFTGLIMANMLSLLIGSLLALFQNYEVNMLMSWLIQFIQILPLLYSLYISSIGLSTLTDKTTGTSLIYLIIAEVINFILLGILSLLWTAVLLL